MTSEEKDREIIRLIAEVRTLQVENKKLAGEYVGLVLAAKELQAKVRMLEGVALGTISEAMDRDAEFDP